jgi:formylmethanofuran dehydrogenase subunit A
MTADGPWQYTLHKLTGNKWINHDVETETGGGIVPFKYRRKSFVHATMWSIALELALLVENPWKIFLTTDHPNGAPFTKYPNIISWLTSKEARERILRKINSRAQRRSLLPSIDREYDLFEIAIVTRAGQSKALGFENKGHIGVGADADVAIFNIDPRKIDPSKDYRKIKKLFQNTAYTIKNGNLVSKDSSIVNSFDGRTFWVDLEKSSCLENTECPDVLLDLKRKFRNYWTVELENYFIKDSYLKNSIPIRIKPEGKKD